MKGYVLDANVFISAQQRWYPVDLCPGFWSALVRHHDAKRIVSIDRIKSELVRMDDAVKDWVEKTSPKSFFKGTADPQVVDSFTDVVNWVQGQAQFTPEAKAEFASVADGWVVAYAKANNFVVVTHEEFAPDAKKKVPLPNVCLEFDVEYCNTFEMLKELKVRFVLKHGRRN